MVRRWLRSRHRSTRDVDAVAALALGALVHDRQDLALYGVAPAGAGEGAVVRVWVDVWATWLDGPF